MCCYPPDREICCIHVTFKCFKYSQKAKRSGLDSSIFCLRVTFKWFSHTSSVTFKIFCCTYVLLWIVESKEETIIFYWPFLDNYGEIQLGTEFLASSSSAEKYITIFCPTISYLRLWCIIVRTRPFDRPYYGLSLQSTANELDGKF